MATRNGEQMPRGGRGLGGTLAWILNGILDNVAGLMMFGICAIVFGNVIARYFFHIGLGWAEEASRMLFIWMCFLGAAIGVRRKGHFRLTMIARWVPSSMHRFLGLAAALSVLGLSLVMIRQGYESWKIANLQTAPMTGLSMGWMYISIPLAGAIMLIYSLGDLVSWLRGRDKYESGHE